MIKIDFKKLQIDKHELRARMGGSFDEKITEDALLRLQSVCDGGFIYNKVPIIRCGDFIDVGFGKTNSKHLIKNLESCTEAYLFVATLGHGCERELKRSALSSPFTQFVTDAVASALCESFCDAAQKMLPKQTKVRFSPGYGDLDLSYQKPFIEKTNATSLLGITLTDNYLMIPTKSVTAVMGIES